MHAYETEYCHSLSTLLFSLISKFCSIYLPLPLNLRGGHQTGFLECQVLNMAI